LSNIAGFGMTSKNAPKNAQCILQHIRKVTVVFQRALNAHTKCTVSEKLLRL
jgi:hypothetical protein